MSDRQLRNKKRPADSRPMLDFVRPQSGSGLRTPLVLMALLSAAAFVSQEYQPWLQKQAGVVAHEGRIGTSLAENANHAVVVATVTATAAEVATAEESHQDRLAMKRKADDLIAVNDLSAPVEVKTEIKQIPRKPQSQSPTRRSPRVIAPAASKTTKHVNAVLAALPESKTVEIDTGSVTFPKVLAQRKEPQQQIVIPEVTFNRHGRLMESKNE